MCTVSKVAETGHDRRTHEPQKLRLWVLYERYVWTEHCGSCMGACFTHTHTHTHTHRDIHTYRDTDTDTHTHTHT